MGQLSDNEATVHDLNDEFRPHVRVNYHSAAEDHLIDMWLADNVGYGNWIEVWGLTQRGFRSFRFHNETDELMFVLRWGRA